jgi:hypothetical protein
MEDYQELKFTGDLSFLNENLIDPKKKLQKGNVEKIITTPIIKTNRSTTLTPIKIRQKMEKSTNLTTTSDKNVNHSNKNIEVSTTNNHALKNDDKKTHLEEMVLNSAYEIEMFNNLKTAILELEKEKIIMKYKQDLIMMILKND